VPAAAVIPAPIAYIKVVAVKKLVVECFAKEAWYTLNELLLHLLQHLFRCLVT
jgi:hypothetical protein